ncbi:MAG: YebC/PmpR family DNA-binding transcriptional regulator [Chloroflexi bacterium]|nr:YebC/PmpR family DNA-binding transcriptional regulator [Chloroflexota bacterium]MCH7642932.1 YebC/PmpR family DNA-binding transcriptional regulator [Chloroflexota bacterium]
MSGHSKWSTIKHKKAATDARRGQIFTKLAREIIVASRDGADPETNFRLRLAIQSAKGANMPNDNIDRAIAKGSGTGDESADLEEVTYEGYGPGGTAILVQALTDNRNRTASHIRSTFSRAGGNLAESGAVSWGFSNSGVILVEASDVDPEEIALEAVDKGAEDFDIEGSSIEFKAAFTDFEPLKAALEAMDGVEVVSAELAMVPSTLVELDDAKARQTLRLLDTLEELEDVQRVFSNADFPDEVMAEYAEAG